MSELPIEIIENYDEKNYHSRPEYSKSMLWQYMKSPLDYWIYHHSDNPPSREPTASMELGSALHMRVLEPSRFNDVYHICSDKDPKKPTAAQLKAKKPSEKTLEQIKAWSLFQKGLEDKIILSAEDSLKVERAASALEKHPVASDLLERATYKELTIIYNYGGLRMRSRIDALIKTDGEVVVLDLKTAKKADAKGFKYAVRDYGYDVQDFLYSYAVAKAYGLKRMPPFTFIAIEMTAPHHIGVYTLSEQSRQSAKHRLDKAIEMLNYSEINNHWPDYNDNQILELEI